MQEAKDLAKFYSKLLEGKGPLKAVQFFQGPGQILRLTYDGVQGAGFVGVIAPVPSVSSFQIALRPIGSNIFQYKTLEFGALAMPMKAAFSAATSQGQAWFFQGYMFPYNYSRSAYTTFPLIAGYQ